MCDSVWQKLGHTNSHRHSSKLNSTHFFKIQFSKVFINLDHLKFRLKGLKVKVLLNFVKSLQKLVQIKKMIVLTLDMKVFFDQKDFFKMKDTKVHSSLEGSPENDDSVRKTPFAKPCTYCSFGIFLSKREGWRMPIKKPRNEFRWNFA